ncbi:hypothetical protein M513_05084 [Trichuris suis]|uniref:Uncharacterized protein n=1 Tax=Trichuris suis TaxID=68888 RepID=A0A085MA19_9BILA|nr:hypothetical protein M513_05084 [Trichuris suis]
MKKSTFGLSGHSKILEQAARLSKQTAKLIPKFHAFQSTSEPEETDQWVSFWNEGEEKFESNGKNGQCRVAQAGAAAQQENQIDKAADAECRPEGELENTSVEDMARKIELRKQTNSDYAKVAMPTHVAKVSFLHLKQFAQFSSIKPDRMFDDGEKIFQDGFMQQQRALIMNTFPEKEAALVGMHKQLIARWQKKAVEEKNKHLSEEECKMLQEYNLTTDDPDMLKKSERMIEVIHETVWPLITEAYRDFKDACCYGKLCLTKLYNYKPDLYEEAMDVVKHLTRIHLDIETMMNDQVDYYLKSDFLFPFTRQITCLCINRAGLVTDLDGEMNAIQQTYTLSKYDDAERERCLKSVQRLARYYDQSRMLILKCLIQPVDDIDLTAAALRNAKTPMDLFVISKQAYLD